MRNIYVRTRGYKIDYNVGFLLTKQLPKMPDSKYSGNIEYPTCVLERSYDNEVYLFLSGIPSQRKDYVKTPIYYDLVLVVNSDVLDGNWEEENNPDGENKKLTWLIWTWLEDVRHALREERQEEGREKLYFVNLPVAGKSELGKRLDDKFPEDYIEKLLRLTKDRNWGKDDENNLNKDLEDFVLQIPKPETMPDLPTLVEHNLPTWWGGVRNDDSCNQWIKLVKKLLNGEKLLKGEIVKGKALLLNGGTDSSLRSLFVENEYLGVLLDREWWDSQLTQIKPSSGNLSKKDKYLKKIRQAVDNDNLMETFVEIAGDEGDSVNKGIQKFLMRYQNDSKKKSQ